MTNTSVVRDLHSIASYLGKYVQKGFADKRLLARKAYFTSRKLRRPVRMRNPQKILTYLSGESTLRLVHTKQFSSGRFGTILYRQLIKK